MTIEEQLADLAAPAPRDLTGAVFGDWARLPSPVGDLYVAFTDVGVSYIRTAESVQDDEDAFRESYRDAFARPLRRAVQPPAGLLPALRHPASAPAVPVDLRGLSPFERDVLTATRRIPPAQTRPYAWVAREIGRPRAVRAVGTALGNNPVPVLVPCHRVTRSDGALGQYVFGAAVKERLLRAEGSDVDGALALARTRVLYLGDPATGAYCYPTCDRGRAAVDRRGFRTAAAAAAAGYHPCPRCAPGP